MTQTLPTCVGKTDIDSQLCNSSASVEDSSQGCNSVGLSTQPACGDAQALQSSVVIDDTRRRYQAERAHVQEQCHKACKRQQ